MFLNRRVGRLSRAHLTENERRWWSSWEWRKETAWRVFVQSSLLPWEWSEAGWWGGLERVLPSFLKEKIKRFNDSIDPCGHLILPLSFAPSCIKWGKNKQLHRKICGACDGVYTLTWTPKGWRLEWLLLNPTCIAFISINKHGSKVSCVVLFEQFNWRRFGRGSRPQWHFSKSLRLLWNPSGGRHDIRAAWHELELLVSGGKNYGRLRSQVIVSNESVAHSGAFFSHGLNSDCLDRLNYHVIIKLSPGLIFQPAHIVLKFILALHSPVFIGYCGYGMNWAHALNLSDLYLCQQVTVCQSAPSCHKSLDF